MSVVQQYIGPFGWSFWFTGEGTPPATRAFPTRFQVLVSALPGKVDATRSATEPKPGKVDPSRTTVSDL